MSSQFNQAVAWWLRAKNLPVKEVLNIEAGDDRGSSTLTGEWGSEYIKVTYLDEANHQQRYTEDVNFAELIRVLADTDWESAATELAAEKAAKAAEKAAKAAELEKWRQETMVALFDPDTDTRVSEWVPFATGKAPVPDEWVKHNKLAVNRMSALQLRMQNGNGVSAARPSVQEVVTRTYAITWRTVW
jgi:predicted Zn-dependent protease